MAGTRKQSGTRIGLDIERERNLELLTKLFSDRETVEFSGTVPEQTDCCIIDAPALERSAERFETWHARESPVFAPVVLLVEADTSQTPSESVLREYVDSVFRIPMPKAEFSARIDNLLQMREFSRKLDTERKLTDLVFESSPLAKLVLELDGTVSRANTRAGELFGVDPTELVGREYRSGGWTAIGADGTEIPADRLPFTRVLETGRAVYGFEHILARPGYDDMWVSVNMAPIRGDSGEIAYVVAVIEDITIRRTQARELERQVDLFRKAEDIANIGAWEYDVQRDVLYWTDKTYEMHGLETDRRLQVEEALEVFHPADQPLIKAAFERAIEDGEPYDIELRLIREDGDQVWVRVHGKPQCEDGGVVRVRGTIQDITDRKEREVELQQMRDAVDKAPIGIVLTDPTQEDNPLIYVNDGFVELTGYTREEAIGRNCRFLQGENTKAETVATLRQKIGAEEPVSVRIRNYRADGSMFWNRLEIAPVRDDDGTVVSYIGFQQDVTDSQERKRQLQILDRYLRHNIRNKMNVINGLAETIRQEGDLSVSGYAASIEQTGLTLVGNTEKAHEITTLLRDDPVPTTTELMDLLESIVADLSDRYPAASIALSGPDSVVITMVPQLATGLEELVRNAIVHNDSASPAVEISVEFLGNAVRVRVLDNGPGIPEMETEVLTDADAETVTNHGQGFGLWLVYLTVRHSGGDIEFTDRKSGGTMVTVELPVET